MMVKLKHVSEEKQCVTEMSQPLHYTVCLKVHLQDNPLKTPIEINFVTKRTHRYGTRTYYIDMSDFYPVAKFQTDKQILLPNSSTSGSSKECIDREQAEIADFANKIAVKYAKDSPRDFNTITNAIIKCFNQEVVGRGLVVNHKVIDDIYYVECNPDGNIVQCNY